MSMEKPQDVTVKIPKAMADWIKEHPAFRLYRSLDDFVVSAVREKMETIGLRIRS